MNGKISISRNSNNEINICIEDKMSGARFIDVKMTPENFALAITNLSSLNCDFELRGLSVVGKKLEVKKELLDAKDLSCSNYAEKILELVKPYEIDGWKVDSYDIRGYNYHKSKKDKYEMTFRRYIEVTD